MKIRDTVKRSGRNLKSAKARTLLTALAIAVGAFTLALTLAAGNGLRAYTDRLIKSNFDPTELFVGRDPEIANNGTPSQTPKEFDDSIASVSIGGQSQLQLKRVTAADVESLKKLPYVEQVRENFQINIRYVTREGQKKYTGSAEAYNQAQRPETKAGSVPANGDIATGTILLPDSYVSLLGFTDDQDAIGKSIQLAVQQPFSTTNLQPQEKVFSYTVSAVTKPPATSFAFGVLPVRLGNADARELYTYTTLGTPDFEKYLFVNVKVKDGNDESKLNAAKEDLIKQGYFVQSTKDAQQQITQIVNVLQIMVGVFGLITVIAAIFGIVNTQYISVLERTREIGLMKALGMSRRAVSRLFMVEATWIGLLGGLLGVAGAIILGVLIDPWVSKKLELGEGNHLIMFNVFQIILLILALMLVATIAGWLPSRKAAKLDPIEALRTE